MAPPEVGEERQNSIPARVLAVLQCLTCQSNLIETVTGLTCEQCARRFPRERGIVRFVESQSYAQSFGFQWKLYGRTQLDDEQSENVFRKETVFTPEDLAGKLVLDVGCGMGRFAAVATRWGAHVVGVDLSAAVEVAAENLRDRSATIFQADVFQLPFALGSFDFIYSLGVLHHTKDCAQAFAMLPPLLKQNGRIAIWVYSAYNRWYRMSEIYRKLTRRMPRGLLHKLCYGVVPLYGVHQVLRKVPGLGKTASGALAYLIPMSFHPNPEWRVLDTFDWYSAWYQSKHTYEEVARWFEGAGLKDIKVLGEPIAMQGRRPGSAEMRNDAEGTSCAG